MGNLCSRQLKNSCLMFFGTSNIKKMKFKVLNLESHNFQTIQRMGVGPLFAATGKFGLDMKMPYFSLDLKAGIQ
jgi:hypothetical protein